SEGLAALRFPTQMPLPEVTGLVSRVMKDVPDGRQLGRQALPDGRVIDVRDDAGFMRFESSEQSRSRRGALRRVAEGMREAHALLIEPPVIRRVDRPREQGCLLIRHED